MSTQADTVPPPALAPRRGAPPSVVILWSGVGFIGVVDTRVGAPGGTGSAVSQGAGVGGGGGGKRPGAESGECPHRLPESAPRGVGKGPGGEGEGGAGAGASLGLGAVGLGAGGGPRLRGARGLGPDLPLPLLLLPRPRRLLLRGRPAAVAHCRAQTAAGQRLAAGRAGPEGAAGWRGRAGRQESPRVDALAAAARRRPPSRPTSPRRTLALLPPRQKIATFRVKPHPPCWAGPNHAEAHLGDQPAPRVVPSPATELCGRAGCQASRCRRSAC